MNESNAPVTVTFRIPGTWSHPRELIARLPADCRLTAEALTLPDESRVEFCVMDADDQFAKIFLSSCRNPPTPEELATVNHYRANVILSGPGGSMSAAHAMMKAAAVMVRAG